MNKAFRFALYPNEAKKILMAKTFGCVRYVYNNKLSRCKIGSRNRDKGRIKVARLHEKIANQRKDFLHKLSRQITNDADAVCVEDLNMKEMS